MATPTITDTRTMELAEQWHEAKRDEAAADKIRKAAAKVRGELAEQLDKILKTGDVLSIHGPQVGAVRPFVEVQWDVIEYDVVAKAAVLDGLRPFLTDDQKVMVAQLEKANRTPVRKLSFKRPS